MRRTKIIVAAGVGIIVATAICCVPVIRLGLWFVCYIIQISYIIRAICSYVKRRKDEYTKLFMYALIVTTISSVLMYDWKWAIITGLLIPIYYYELKQKERD